MISIKQGLTSREKIAIVDMITILPKTKETHKTEVVNFCAAAGLSVVQFHALGFLLFASHIKHHQLGSPQHPMKVLTASAQTFKVWFNNDPKFDPCIMDNCGNVAHGECWVNKKYLKNKWVHTYDDLQSYSDFLVNAYRHLVRVPDTSRIAFRFAGRDGDEMTEEEKAASRESQLEICRKGGRNCWAIVDDAMQAYLIGEASSTQIKVLETYGAGKTFMIWEKMHAGEALLVSSER